MHLERLVIEAGGDTFSLDLHAGMTVVAGVGALERRGLVKELVAAMGPGHPGVHLELRTDAGRRLAVFRPSRGAHRVVDVDRAQDLTQAYKAPDGSVDLLGSAGLTVEGATRAMTIGPGDLADPRGETQRIATLAGIDQTRLWEVAAKVRERAERLAEVTAELNGDRTDAEVVREIERRHAEFEQAQGEAERARRTSLLVGANAAVAGFALLLWLGVWAMVPAAVLAMAMTAHSIVWWRRVERASAREDEALRTAGATSYLTFQINRVNSLLSDDQQRRRLMRAAEYHRAALAEWHLLAGDVDVDWAIARRSRVRQAAASVEARRAASPGAAAVDPAVIVGERLRVLSRGLGDESLPLLVDEPFSALASAAKADLLEALVEASRTQQVIVLTEDPDVAAWARVERLTGGLALVEPATEPTPEPQRAGPGGRVLSA